MAVLRVVGTPPDIRALKINPNPVRRNSRVRVIGHPFNVAQGWTSTTGEMINFAPNNPKLTIDVSMAEGSSGGPVINAQDEMIGMVVQLPTDRDIATDPNEPTQDVTNVSVATRGVGLAYRVEVLVNQLKVWVVLN